MTAKNVDEMLLQRPTNDPVDVAPNAIAKPEEVEEKVDNKVEKVEKENDSSNDSSSDDSDYSSDDLDKSKDDSNKNTEESSSEEDEDEYGNDVPKSRMYTEEQVNKLLRERLRGKLSQEQQIETKQAVQDFKVDENSNDDWQKQLDDFIDRRLETREKDKLNRAYQEREYKARIEFEDKFTSGMAKYKDFIDVVSDKPISDAMVVATRSFKDPAAFLYAAAKNHSKELTEISQLTDPYQQAARIGRLEEKMRKNKQATRSARPIESDKGDVTDPKATSRHNIDDLIAKHARTRAR